MFGFSFRKRQQNRPERFDRLAYYKSLNLTAPSSVPVPSRLGRRYVVKGATALLVGGTSYLTLRPTQIFNRSSMELLAHFDIDETLPASGDVSFVRLPGLKPQAPNEDGTTVASFQATQAELAEYEDAESNIQDPLEALRATNNLTNTLVLSEAPQPELPIFPGQKPDQSAYAPIIPRGKGKPPKRPKRSLASLRSKDNKTTTRRSSKGGPTRTISLFSINTGDRIKATYMKNGKYVNSELKRLNWLMRDRRNGKQKRIDPKLYDLIYRLTVNIGAKGQTVNVISGYRSPETNRKLRRNSSGVASSSYHTRGKAVDLSIKGHSISSVHRNALSLNGGGVGYYPSSNFVHVDTGPVRNWPSRYRHIARKYQRAA